MYDRIMMKFADIVNENKLSDEIVSVTSQTLFPEEVIGNPEDDDNSIRKGRKRMMVAEFKGSYGQSFTDMFGGYEGEISRILDVPLDNSFARSVFISTVNAVMRHLQLIDKTMHCKDKGPKTCCRELVSYIKKEYDNPRIALVGLQPRMLKALSEEFQLRVTDLDEENIGRQKFGIVIDSPEQTEANLNWCDIALVTGTTLVNDTIDAFKIEKPTIFFGVSIAGPAHLLGLTHFCPCST
jgi:hypothetical protein